MKRLLIATALVAATVGSASAMTTGDGNLPNTARAEAQSLVPRGNFDSLTTAQVGAIMQVLSAGDSERGAQIRSILMWN